MTQAKALTYLERLVALCCFVLLGSGALSALRAGQAPLAEDGGKLVASSAPALESSCETDSDPRLPLTEPPLSTLGLASSFPCVHQARLAPRLEGVRQAGCRVLLSGNEARGPPRAHL